MGKTLITPNIKTVKKGKRTLVICGSESFGKKRNVVVGASSGTSMTTGSKSVTIGRKASTKTKKAKKK